MARKLHLETIHPEALGYIMTATADAIRYIESEIEKCGDDAGEHRAFLEQRLASHYVANGAISRAYWSSRKPKSACSLAPTA